MGEFIDSETGEAITSWNAAMELIGIVQMDDGTLANQIAFKNHGAYSSGLLAAYSDNTLCIADTIWDVTPAGFDVSFVLFDEPEYSDSEPYSFTDLKLDDCYTRTKEW